MHMIESDNTLTMSSREIAEVVGKRHDTVKRTIERLASKIDKNGNPKPVITLPPMVETSFLDATGKTQWVSEYRIGKRDSYVIVAQLSPEFTAAMVDRWQELEAQAAKPAAIETPATPRPDLVMQFAQLTMDALPNLGENARQCLLSHASELAFGQRLIPLPVITEHHMNATEVGELLGISAAMVGRIANKHGLKTAEHGETRLDKSRHSSKQVESFVYNRAGVDRLRSILAETA